jgi:hypothetical protein
MLWLLSVSATGPFCEHTESGNYALNPCPQEHKAKQRSNFSVKSRRTISIIFSFCLIFINAIAGMVQAQEADMESELRLIRERIKVLEDARQGNESVRSSEETRNGSQQDATANDTDKSPVKVGGALRFNYRVNDYDENNKEKRGQTGLDIFRINADGQLGSLVLSAEYRFYTYMNTIHHGWVGYEFSNSQRIQGGITRVPFGLLPYASHNYYFGVPFYLGIADDYDLGIKYLHEAGPWDMQLAFFKNEELGNSANLERYSFDPVTTGTARNEESNTFNARGTYTIGKGSLCAHELGVSGQYGELFNLDTGENGDHWGTAAHLDSRCGRWNFQLQYARYGYDARNPSGVADDVVTLGAFASSYDIAAYGDVAVFNVAYNIPVDWPNVDLLTCYNDYSVLMKDKDEFDNSYINTTGCLLSSGAIFTYFDIIRARNMVFFDGGSLAGGGTGGWKTRFNINFGIYW